jgi:hypothetical protein
MAENILNSPSRPVILVVLVSHAPHVLQYQSSGLLES